jgi:hypothetical protein
MLDGFVSSHPQIGRPYGCSIVKGSQPRQVINLIVIVDVFPANFANINKPSK